MMEFTIVRENNKEYGVVPVCEEQKDFTEKMILENRVPGLLPVKLREFNGEASYYYETTGCRAFAKMFQNDNDVMEVKDVEMLCESIIRVTESVREYMLDIDDILLDSDTLFFNTEKDRYEFVYIPGRFKSEENRGSFRLGLRAVWEKVLKKINKNADKEFIMKLYDIYQKMSVDNFNPENIFDLKTEGESAQKEVVVFEKPKLPEDDIFEELYDEKKIDEIIEEEKKTIPKKKKYAYIGGAAAAVAAVFFAVL